MAVALVTEQLNHRSDLIAKMGLECKQGLRGDGDGAGDLGGRDPCGVLWALGFKSCVVCHPLASNRTARGFPEVFFWRRLKV